MVARTDRGATRRGVRVVAWILAIFALYLSLPGWFTWFGLGLALPTMIFTAYVRERGAFITAVVAACVAVAWLSFNFLVS